MTHREERPICPRCELQMTVASVTTEGEHEVWVYRCATCGCETSVILQPLE